MPPIRFAAVYSLMLVSILGAACGPGPARATPQLVNVYSTAAAQPWLAPLYVCAGALTAIARVPDPASADIVLRVGEPEVLVFPAYQIGTEEILIVAHRQSPIQNLTLGEARVLFMGRGDPSVQVWVYGMGEDIQTVFEKAVMDGRPISPSAAVAVTPMQMSDILVNESNAVGFLPGHWKAGESRVLFELTDVPVLAIAYTEPAGLVRDLLGCLQK